MLIYFIIAAVIFMIGCFLIGAFAHDEEDVFYGAFALLLAACLWPLTILTIVPLGLGARARSFFRRET